MPDETKTAPTPTPKNRAVQAPQVKVRVVKQPVHENGRTYLKGEVIETDQDRADALGELVVPHTA